MSQFFQKAICRFRQVRSAAGLLGHGCTSTTSEKTTQSINYAAPTTNGLEVNQIRLGFIALTDAAPLIIALEKGFFSQIRSDSS